MRTRTTKLMQQSLEGRTKLKHRAGQLKDPKSTPGMSETSLGQTGRKRKEFRSTKGRQRSSRVYLTGHRWHM